MVLFREERSGAQGLGGAGRGLWWGWARPVPWRDTQSAQWAPALGPWPAACEHYHYGHRHQCCPSRWRIITTVKRCLSGGWWTGKWKHEGRKAARECCLQHSEVFRDGFNSSPARLPFAQLTGKPCNSSVVFKSLSRIQMLHTGGWKRCKGPGFPRRRTEPGQGVEALPTDS